MQECLDVVEQYRILITSYLQNPKVFLIGWIVSTIILSNVVYLLSDKKERHLASVAFSCLICFAASAFWEFAIILLVMIAVSLIIGFIITLPSRIISCLTGYRLVKRSQ